MQDDGGVGVRECERRSLSVRVSGVERMDPTSHLRREIHLLGVNLLRFMSVSVSERIFVDLQSLQ